MRKTINFWNTPTENRIYFDFLDNRMKWMIEEELNPLVISGFERDNVNF